MAILVVNPYAGVNWATYEQYKANFHTHTNESDGAATPAATIDLYDAAGYEILALTDHDLTSYPWSTYSKDPAALGMIAVAGQEISTNDHIVALFSTEAAYEDADEDATVADIAAHNGLVIMAHPGQYINNDVKDTFYAQLKLDYPLLNGIEVYNQGDKYETDRRIWDRVNILTMGGYTNKKPVWGYANDDMHTVANRFCDFNFMLMPELTETALKTCMTNGAFYFCYEPGKTGTADVPRISSIVVDEEAHTITIAGTDYTSVEWHSEIEVVGTDEVFDYNIFHGVFVRAVLVSATGKTYTQPFGFNHEVAVIL